MATVVGRVGGCLYVNSGYLLKNSHSLEENDEYDDDGQFSDDEECDAKKPPPPPITKNFTLKSSTVSPSNVRKFGLKAQLSDQMDNGRNEFATADQPLYNVPAKKSATPKLKKSASVHPRVKPPPPPVAVVAGRLTKSPSCGSNDPATASKSSSNQCGGRFHRTFADKSARENGTNAKIREVELDDMNWFHGHIDRQTAEKKLFEMNKDGSFLFRHKSDVVPNVPYALSVLHKVKVYHLEIRQKRNGHFALGDMKDGEAEFSCLQSLVCYFKRKPLQLIKRSTSEISGSTILTVTPQK